MTAKQKQNISRGVRLARIRRRQSDAMKASWVRRRALLDSAENNSTPTVCHTPTLNSQQLIASLCRRHDLDEFTLGQLDDLVCLCEAFNDHRTNE